MLPEGAKAVKAQVLGKKIGVASAARSGILLRLLFGRRPGIRAA
jgi:hypothetical protein